MVILFGSHGYLGRVFGEELNWRGMRWVAGERESFACQLLEYPRPATVINCAAFIPGGATTNCEFQIAECILGNAVWPVRLADACLERGFVLAHLSTGCLWDDAMSVMSVMSEHGEGDEAQRGFGGYSGMYVGCKLVAERVIEQMARTYIFRVRLPFDEFDHPKNYLTKLAKYPETFDQCNSLSHRLDCVRACLDLIEKPAPFGTYHVVYEGSLKASEIVERLVMKGIKPVPIQMVAGPGGAAVLSIEKLKAAGVKIRNVNEAFAESLDKWTTGTQCTYV